MTQQQLPPAEEPGMYHVAAFCTNCDWRGYLQMPKGKECSGTHKCPNCECTTAKKELPPLKGPVDPLERQWRGAPPVSWEQPSVPKKPQGDVWIQCEGPPSVQWKDCIFDTDQAGDKPGA